MRIGRRLKRNGVAWPIPWSGHPKNPLFVLDASFYNSTVSTWTLATPRTTWELELAINNDMCRDQNVPEMLRILLKIHEEK